MALLMPMAPDALTVMGAVPVIGPPLVVVAQVVHVKGVPADPSPPIGEVTWLPPAPPPNESMTLPELSTTLTVEL